MHRIDKTFFPTEEHEHAFQRLCNNHITELRAHKEQMRMVAKTEGLEHDDPRKYHPYPPPSAHPDVVAAVVADGDDFNVQYELFDPKTTEEKKQDLLNSVARQAADLQEKIYPTQKRALLSFKASEASVKENRLPSDQASIELQDRVSKQSYDIAYHLAVLQSEIHDLTDKTIDNYKPASFPEI